MPEERLSNHAASVTFNPVKCQCGCETYKLSLHDESGAIFAQCGLTARQWLELMQSMTLVIAQDAKSEIKKIKGALQ